LKPPQKSFVALCRLPRLTEARVENELFLLGL
jgi:hypothetical protein